MSVMFMALAIQQTKLSLCKGWRSDSKSCSTERSAVHSRNPSSPGRPDGLKPVLTSCSWTQRESPRTARIAVTLSPQNTSSLAICWFSQRGQGIMISGSWDSLPAIMLITGVMTRKSRICQISTAVCLFSPLFSNPYLSGARKTGREMQLIAKWY